MNENKLSSKLLKIAKSLVAADYSEWQNFSDSDSYTLNGIPIKDSIKKIRYYLKSLNNIENNNNIDFKNKNTINDAADALNKFEVAFNTIGNNKVRRVIRISPHN